MNQIQDPNGEDPPAKSLPAKVIVKLFQTVCTLLKIGLRKFGNVYTTFHVQVFSFERNYITAYGQNMHILRFSEAPFDLNSAHCCGQLWV